MGPNATAVRYLMVPFPEDLLVIFGTLEPVYTWKPHLFAVIYAYISQGPATIQVGAQLGEQEPARKWERGQKWKPGRGGGTGDAFPTGNHPPVNI